MEASNGAKYIHQTRTDIAYKFDVLRIMPYAWRATILDVASF